MDKVRELISKPELIKYKIKLFGYDKNQVKEQITSMNLNYQEAVCNYEKNIEEQNTSLNMAIREKEKLNMKVKELEKQVELLDPKKDETKSALLADNMKLKSEIEKLSLLKKDIEIVTNENKTLKTKCDYFIGKEEEYKTIIKEKDDALINQCKENSNIIQNNTLQVAQIKADYEAKIEMMNLSIHRLKEYISKAIDVIDEI